MICDVKPFVLTYDILASKHRDLMFKSVFDRLIGSHSISSIKSHISIISGMDKTR